MPQKVIPASERQHSQCLGGSSCERNRGRGDAVDLLERFLGIAIIIRKLVAEEEGLFEKGLGRLDLGEGEGQQRIQDVVVLVLDDDVLGVLGVEGLKER